jgi:hypothetical protein
VNLNPNCQRVSSALHWRTVPLLAAVKLLLLLLLLLVSPGMLVTCA